MKFKVGDKVIAIDDHVGDYIHRGDVFKVLKFHENGWAVEVEPVLTKSDWWTRSAFTRANKLRKLTKLDKVLK